MQDQNETGPALAGARTGELDHAGKLIGSECSAATQHLQAARLQRLYALSVEAAHTIARLAFAAGPR